MANVAKCETRRRKHIAREGVRPTLKTGGGRVRLCVGIVSRSLFYRGPFLGEDPGGSSSNGTYHNGPCGNDDDACKTLSGPFRNFQATEHCANARPQFRHWRVIVGQTVFNEPARRRCLASNRLIICRANGLALRPRPKSLVATDRGEAACVDLAAFDQRSEQRRAIGIVKRHSVFATRGGLMSRDLRSRKR